MRDPELLRRLHAQPPAWRRCALNPDHDRRASLHHIHKHPRDDVIANLVWLCGDGTTGCHGLVEHHDPATMALLAEYLRGRPDFRGYLAHKFREQGIEQSVAAADEWITNLTRSKLHRPT